MPFARNGTGEILVLWDVDHTLIETRGVGRAAFAIAFEQVTGRALEAMPHITGRTEPDIYAATTALHEISYPPPFPVFAGALAAAYVKLQERLREQGRVMPGAEQALNHLATATGIRQSVLTGNTRRVTRTKLETFDLTKYLDLETAAYGDDDGYRPALVAIAQARAANRGGMFDQQNTVLIGDSVGDIETAREGGAHIIAIAAGGTDAADLAVADIVLADLTDPAGIEGAIRRLVQG
ncbi:HAD hydrolase-like protein [Nocardia sp. CDC153]|uniref:HAD family hydrolase n=1 Tax=Nocardia sp. CDC153 TaxID=3112167 RepID=UPI002DB78261|nr:HAD hydrolase-like protein [Nocardia sp. CDC153]MEC3953627.1 HAD hydrolase-like protein [Nocardia sp. CDC153]